MHLGLSTSFITLTYPTMSLRRLVRHRPLIPRSRRVCRAPNALAFEARSVGSTSPWPWTSPISRNTCIPSATPLDPRVDLSALQREVINAPSPPLVAPDNLLELSMDTFANILGLIVLGSAVSKISQALAEMRAVSEADDRQRREIRLRPGRGEMRRCPGFRCDVRCFREVLVCFRELVALYIFMNIHDVHLFFLVSVRFPTDFEGLEGPKRLGSRRYLQSQSAPFELVSRIMKFVDYRLEKRLGVQEVPRKTLQKMALRPVFRAESRSRGCRTPPSIAP